MHARSRSAQPRPGRRALLVVNPASGRSSVLAPERLARLLESHGLEVDCHVEKQASEVARGAEDRGYDLVVAAGGDGTLRSVACATRLPVAAIPAGTSNSVARSLGIPLDMKEACRLAATGQARDVDLGEAEGPDLAEPVTTFLLCASAGFDAEAARRYERRRGARSSMLRYAGIVTETALFHVHRDVRVLADGRHVATGKLVIASNCRHYGGIFKPAPGASPADGLLDLVAIRSYGLWGLVGAGVYALLGVPQRPSRARVLRLSSLRLESDHDVPFEVDGEPVGRLPVEIRVRPGALRIVTGI